VCGVVVDGDLVEQGVRGVALRGGEAGAQLGADDPLAAPDLLLSTGVTDGMRFYADVYAARQLPFTLLFLAMLIRPRRSALLPMLVAAGLIQASDAVVGVVWGLPNLLIGGIFLAVIHLGSADWIHSGRTK
jgi:hypothetical protein